MTYPNPNPHHGPYSPPPQPPAQGDYALQHSTWMVGNQYKAAELGKSEWDVIRESPPYAVDAWGLGCLMQEVFSVESMKSVENLRSAAVRRVGGGAHDSQC